MLVEARLAAEMVVHALSPSRFRTVRCMSGLPAGAALRRADVIWENGGWVLRVGFECPGDDGPPLSITPQYAERFDRQHYHQIIADCVAYVDPGWDADLVARMKAVLADEC